MAVSGEGSSDTGGAFEGFGAILSIWSVEESGRGGERSDTYLTPYLTHILTHILTRI